MSILDQIRPAIELVISTALVAEDQLRRRNEKLLVAANEHGAVTDEVVVMHVQCSAAAAQHLALAHTVKTCMDVGFEVVEVYLMLLEDVKTSVKRLEDLGEQVDALTLRVQRSEPVEETQEPVQDKTLVDVDAANVLRHFGIN